MKTLSLSEYQECIGIAVDNGQITDASRFALMALIREIVIAKTMIKRRELHQRLEMLLKPLCPDVKNIRENVDASLERLINLKEITCLYCTGQQPVFMPSRPRWIKLSEDDAILLGYVVSKDLQIMQKDRNDVFRRFVPNTDAMAFLCENGVEETTVFDWLSLSLGGEYCKDVPMLRNEKWQTTLARFYYENISQLRVQTAEPRSGNIKVIRRTPDGICFCYIYRYYGSPSWVMMLEEEKEAVKILHLYDENQWRCLLLASGLKDSFRIPSFLEHLSMIGKDVKS